MMKWGALANPNARRRPAEATLSGIAADKATGTAYEIINQSINQSVDSFMRPSSNAFWRNRVA